MQISDMASPLDFRRFFEASPGLFMVLNPELNIIAVTDAYLAATMTQRDKIIGRHLFEVFPDNPDDDEATGTGNLRASLERALSHKKPDIMAIQKYDIRRPPEQGGGFEVRYWSPVNFPVLSESGEVMYIIHRAEDVTDFVKLKETGLAKQSAALQGTRDAEQAEKLRQAQGYTVMAAANGAAALEIIATGQFKPDLLLTDVVMPEMTGNALVAKAKAYDKKMRVLYLSGYAPEALTNYDISEAEPHFLEKPFSLNQLLIKIREILSPA